MEVVVIPRDARLSRRDGALVVHSDAGRKPIPLNGVKHVVCLGNGSISIPLLKEMGKRGIRFSLLDGRRGFVGAFEPEEETPSGRVRIGQASLFLDEAQRLRIALAFVRAQVKSIRGLLLRYRRNGTRGLGPAVGAMDGVLEMVDRAGTVEALRGAEGQGRSLLHDSFGRIAVAAKLSRRIRRPPPDPVNCLMSFFNMSLYSACAGELAKTHLDRSIAFLHAPGVGRRSLSLDIAEPFRPVLSDALLLAMFRRNEVDATWFDRTPGVCVLNEKGRGKASRRFWTRMEERIGDCSLRQHIHRQCLSLERDALRLGRFKPFVWRG